MPAGNRLADRVRRRLAALGADGLLRTLRPPHGIDLSSNDYLNLAKDPRVTAAFAVGAARAGVGSTGSRLLRGDRAIFGELEAAFARFKGTEGALFFSSGYLANLTVLSALSEPGDVVFSDERNHASLIDATRLARGRTIVTPHADVGRLSDLLATTPCDGVRFVVVESLYSMDGDCPDLTAYFHVCEQAGAVLVVDEAHAVGVFGERGSGLIEAAGLDANRVISINTGGKALGVAGALIAGPSWAIDYLTQRGRPFVFSTAAPPAVADALLASLAIVEREPERRHRVIAAARHLRDLLRHAGFDVADSASQIVPIVIGENERTLAVAQAIQDEGFDVRAIRPPSVPEGTSRLRVSVNAALTDALLTRFVDVLVAAHPCVASS
jgi:8-amino-7-oxononanoate synthase